MRTLLFLTLVSLAHAGSRTSTHYSIPIESNGSSGTAPATSADYSAEISFAMEGGLQSANAPVITQLGSGYPAQFTDVALFDVQIASTVNETASTPATAQLVNTDLSRTDVLASAVNWQVSSGPGSINGSGLYTASAVFEINPAQITGTLGPLSDIAAFTLIDVLPDNFGIYANDDLPDNWQVNNFGINSPNGLPTADPDKDGQHNAFEFMTGVDPTLSSSFFRVFIEPSGTGSFNVRFQPRLGTRQYALLTSSNLAQWQSSGLTAQADGGNGLFSLTTGTSRLFFKVAVDLAP